MQCSGNHIKAGCIYMTFNVDSSGEREREREVEVQQIITTFIILNEYFIEFCMYQKHSHTYTLDLTIIYFFSCLGGGNLGVLPVSSTGRLVNGLPLLPAHGGQLTYCMTA